MQKKKDIYALGLTYFQLATNLTHTKMWEIMKDHCTLIQQENGSEVCISEGQREGFLLAISTELKSACVEEDVKKIILKCVEPDIYRRVSSEQLAGLIDSL